MQPEILKAISKPAAIKRIVIYAVIGFAIILLGKVIFFTWLKGYLSINDQVEAVSRFKIVMSAISVSLLPFVIYLFFIASRIISSQQFPYPGARVMRNMPVVHGRQAIFRGLAIGLAGVWLLGCAIFAAAIPNMQSNHNGSRPNIVVTQDGSPTPRGTP